MPPPKPKPKPRFDLPVELWIHILSYLPPNTARRLIAVSRSLFQLALDDLYGKVDITFDNEKTRYRITQLRPIPMDIRNRHLDLSRRVCHLQISPTFLSVPPSRQTSSTESGVLKDWIRGRIRAFTPGQATQTILQLATSTLVCCDNLRQLTVILHGCDPNRELLLLLDAVIKTMVKNPQLKMLAIDTPVSKLLALTQSLTQNPQSLSRLEDLKIVLPATFQRAPESCMSGFHALMLIMSISKNTLRSFNFCSSLTVNLDKCLGNIPWFTRLRSLTICAVITDKTFPTKDGLFSLIQKHAHQLEHLEIMPAPTHDPYQRLFDSGYQYELLFLVPDSLQQQTTISRFVFPKLTCFHVGMPNHWHEPVRPKSPLPPLAPIMPNLAALVLNPGFKMPFSALQDLIEGLPLQNGIIGLKRLEVSCHILDLQVLDTLASRLPNLYSLTINYQLLSTESGTTVPPLPSRTADVVWLPFVMAMKTRRYTNWHIEELRVARVAPDSMCCVPHPALPAMAAVASSLPLGKRVSLDRSYKCRCLPE